MPIYNQLKNNKLNKPKHGFLYFSQDIRHFKIDGSKSDMFSGTNQLHVTP